MLADKLIGTTAFGLLVAMMSAINDEFRHKLVTLASGGVVEEANPANLILPVLNGSAF